MGLDGCGEILYPVIVLGWRGLCGESCTLIVRFKKF